MKIARTYSIGKHPVYRIVTGSISIILGILILIAAAYIKSEDEKFMNTAVEVSAYIEYVNTKTDDDGDKTYDVTLSYEYGGDEYTKSFSDVGSDIGKRGRGGTVILYVNPQNPSDSRLNNNPFVFIVLCIIGVIVLLRGLLRTVIAIVKMIYIKQISSNNVVYQMQANQSDNIPQNNYNNNYNNNPPQDNYNNYNSNNYNNSNMPQNDNFNNNNNSNYPPYNQ